MKMSVSQSQIHLYRDCPYAYALRYKYKKQGMMWDHEVFNVGRTVHDAIDLYYKTQYSTEETEETIYSKSYAILRNIWAKLIEEEKPKDSAIQLKKASICLRNFAEFEASNINQAIPTKPLTEIKIYSKDLMGIIDYFEPSRPKILDFKTSAYPSVGYKEKIQAVMYKHLVKESYDIDLDFFTFYYLYPNKKRYVKFDAKSDDIFQDILSYKDNILQSWKTGNFPKKPRTKSMCNSCQYRFYCKGLKND